MHWTLRVFGVTTLALLLAPGGRAAWPPSLAIVNARIVPVVGPPVERGTVLLRAGRIADVGPRVAVPEEAQVIDGSGLSVYPGLIDMGATGLTEVPGPPEPRAPRTRDEVERWKRSVLLRPQVEAAAYVKVDAAELLRFAAAGITTVLAVPDGEGVHGRSALVNVVAPPEEPQIGALAQPRQGLVVLKAPVALHVSFPERPRGEAYPASLMGVIAFVRQSFLDAQHYRVAWDGYARGVDGASRPAHDPALEALQPALAGTLPVVFETASAREIRRALGMAAAFALRAMIGGGLGAHEVVDDLKAAGTPVLYTLNYPTRPRALAPDADEPLRVLWERAQAPRTPGVLAAAGVPFAFQSGGLRDPRDFVRHVRRAVREGLAPEAALRALTIEAARLAGVDRQLGSIEPGKIANLIVTDGDLFGEATQVRHVLIDGRPVTIEPLPERRNVRPPGDPAWSR